jgi:hypothetical protein
MDVRSALSLFFGLAMASATAQNDYDARILSYEGLRFSCEGSVQPNLKIQNVGGQSMSTCVVETWKNGLQVNSFNWILAIPALSGDVRQPALPPIGDVLPGDEVEFRIKTVNTVPDQGAEGNDLTVALDQVPKFAEGGAVMVEVTTGVVTGEVSWSIKNALSQVVAQGGPYVESNTIMQVPVALNDLDCYAFAASDASRGTSVEVQIRVLDANGAVIDVDGTELITPYSEGLRTGNGNPCSQDLTLELSTDDGSEETSWEVVVQGTNAVLCAGVGLADNATYTADCCLQEGCFALRVFDSAGDGITGGGYILRTTGSNQRIIDNRNNFNTGSVSAISGGQGFCLPLSNDKVIFTSCDKLDWSNGQYVVATPNAAVSAEWIVGGANSVQDANSGYEFWIFDPNGSYSFRRFRSHNVSDGFGPASATRACHMKLNNWAVASQVPANDLMNVRVRARVNGVNGEFGPACRLMIDPVRAACPLTNLMDVPGNQYFSCGVIRQWGLSNSIIAARPVTGANRYQFRFRQPGEGFEVVITRTTYTLQLNWSAATGLPLQNGQTYDVDVRVSKDGGTTYCTSSSPWGNICSVTIGSSNVNANTLMDDVQEGATIADELLLFPNPNRGDVLNFSLSAIEKGVNTVTVDIYDLTGKRMSARTIAVIEGNVNTTLDLNGELAAGMYLVNITAGATVHTERLVLRP